MEADRRERIGAAAGRWFGVTDQKPAGVAGAGGRKASSVIMLAALVDLLVIVPYSYWRLHSHQLAMIIACLIEGIGMLSLLGIALSLRRRGS